MKTEITYNDLRALDKDIARMQQSPALSLFLRKYIFAFYNKNFIRLDIMTKTAKEAITKYVKHETDKPVTKKDDNGTEVYVFNDEAAEAAYISEMTAFWNLTFEIET